MNTNNKSLTLKRSVSLIFLLLWMGLIFFLSHQTANQSSHLSGGLIATVLKFIFPDLPADKLNVLISGSQFIVRKGAHFTLYAVLGFLSFFTLITYERLHIALRCLFAFIIGATYSVTDEFHQTFIPGRSGELRDICIDSSGVLTGVLMSLAIFKIYCFIKKRKANSMRKKQYIELTETLQRELSKAKLVLTELQEENEALIKETSELKLEILKLQAELEAKEAPLIEQNPVSDTDNEIIENPPQQTVDIPDDMTYGSKIIGKIVLSAATYCNTLTAIPSNENVKELVNLILGRTEVAKSEILKIVALDIDHQSKIVAMEKEAAEAEDYFKSVMAQK